MEQIDVKVAFIGLSTYGSLPEFHHITSTENSLNAMKENNAVDEERHNEDMTETILISSYGICEVLRLRGSFSLETTNIYH